MAAAVPCKKFEAKACLRCRDKHLTCEFATKTRAGSKRSGKQESQANKFSTDLM